MTQSKLPDCAVIAKFVYEMQVGDVAAVEVAGIVAPGKKPFIFGGAGLHEPGEGLVTVERREDGFHIDLSHVPGVRFDREPRRGVYRVKSWTGLICA